MKRMLFLSTLMVAAGINLHAKEFTRPLEPKELSDILNIDIFAKHTPFALYANYSIDNSWPTSYQVTVTLMNPRANPTASWTASFQLPPGQSISSVWNGVFSSSGQSVTVTNPAWTGGEIILGGETTTFGMIVENPSGSDSIGLLHLQASAD